MDFGDYIYIILAIVFSVVGALSKKKKTVVKKSNSRFQEMFSDLFDEQASDDPIEQMSSYVTEEKSPSETVVSESVEEKAKAPMSLMQEYELLKNREAVKVSDSIVLEERVKPVKRHYLLEDLKNREELQKALIYSEVFKPKFESI